MHEAAAIAVIGGTGLYALLDGGEELEVDTPYGRPSSPLVRHDVEGQRVVFLARHGLGHEHPPHRVPYLANIWALAAVGATRVLAPCAVGSLRSDVAPGQLVVPDQLLDRTHDRPTTFFDAAAIHVPFADPYCPQLRRAAVATATEIGAPVRDGGTMVVVAGPRFGTRAEASWHSQAGADIVNMTALPEAALAREAGLCYASVGVVTDWDAGAHADTGVTQTEVMDAFAAAVSSVRALLVRLVTALPDERACTCSAALAGLDVPDVLPRAVR